MSSKPTLTFTTSIIFVHSILNALSRYQSSPARLLEASDIPLSLLREPSARIGAEQFTAFVNLVVETFDDEGIGLFSRPLRRGSFEFLCRGMLSAATLEEAFKRWIRYSRLIIDDIEMEMLCDGNLIGLSIVELCPPGEHSIFMRETVIRSVFALACWMIKERIKPTRTDFAHARPSYVTEYDAIYPGPYFFDKPRSVLWLDPVYLSMPVRRSEEELNELIRHVPASLLTQYHNQSIVSVQVRAQLQRALPEVRGLPQIAHALNLSSSTLHRQLLTEGTSFQEIKDNLRRDMAISMLSATTGTIAEISEKLGFADSTTFHRAFKLWTGVAPSVYRSQ
ncbi:MAG: AraC family transcriptional regulator [Burkholderiales bacterium]